MIKHFTTSTYLFNDSFSKTLFLLHPKFKKWLPPGGHIEENESPEEAARREIREEIGIVDVNFISSPNEPDFEDRRTLMLLKPHFMMSQFIEENHYHLDMIFFAIVKDIIYNSPENHKIKWFNFDELKQEINMFENVKNLAIYGFKELVK